MRLTWVSASRVEETGAMPAVRLASIQPSSPEYILKSPAQSPETMWPATYSMQQN